VKHFLTLLIFVSIWSKIFAADLIDYDYEVDAYYSKALLFIDLDRDNNITDALEYAEEEIYKEMLLNAFSPNVFSLEAALHPMSFVGLYFRQNYGDMYEKSKINTFNPVKVITAGYDEPYSFSFFIGRMMVFKNKKNDRIGNNRAYMGFILSVGDQSIKDNLAHYDKWHNIEFKLQGIRNTDERDLEWNFRVGTKVHQNQDFTNSLFISAKRSSIDYKKSDWSFIYNTAFYFSLAVRTDTYKLTEAEFIAEKKWPLSLSQKISFGLSIGYLFNTGDKYKGALKEEGIVKHQLILRPNFKW